LALANQLARHFQHDRGNVPSREKVFSILKSFRGKPVFLVQSVSKRAEGRSVTGKQVWRQAGKGPDTGLLQLLHGKPFIIRHRSPVHCPVGLARPEELVRCAEAIHGLPPKLT
jgi:hypothetical protein